MHFTNLLLPTLGFLSSIASAAPSVSVTPPDSHIPSRFPQSCDDFRKHHPYQYPPKNHRKVHHIRSSHDEHDDVSDEFLKGIKAANNGGTLLLKKGKTYVIGKKLDLTFLNDFQLQLDGKILVGGFYPLFAPLLTLHPHSSPTILPTGKTQRTTSTIHSRSPSPSGNGEART